jgi:hypothetical protein
LLPSQVVTGDGPSGEIARLSAMKAFASNSRMAG